jgi:hypothetical protein
LAKPLPNQANFFEIFERLPESKPEPIAKKSAPLVIEDGSLSDGCRCIWKDRDGIDWHGDYRFSIGKFAFIILDEHQPNGMPRIARSFRVNPDALRVEGGVLV